MKIVLLASVCALFLSGCATPPSADEMARAYYGEYPKDSEAIIKDYMGRILKDPMSATYRFQPFAQKMWVGGGLMGPRKFGWGQCAAINAKNSFGGYVGEKPYFFLIVDNRVIDYQDASYTKLCRNI